ncbi:DUF4189 domain-containing protein [Neisseria sp. Ec49-e6-T10]|uniref:DUF4189 domain-containing protein n=1 Tax=Neisseria sp. Ec49-e6-T10 TaxID=3140744 RepID=UPI003EB6FE49
MKKMLLGILLFSFSIFGFAQESEQDRIAREHQPGGLYDKSNSGNGNGSFQLPLVWGAIAIDSKTFQGGGFANSENSLSDAKKLALSECKKRAGRSCKVVVNYALDHCGAVALSQGTDVWSAEMRRLRKDANAAALQSCNDKVRKLGKTPDCTLWIPGRCALFSGS